MTEVEQHISSSLKKIMKWEAVVIYSILIQELHEFSC